MVKIGNEGYLLNLIGFLLIGSGLYFIFQLGRKKGIDEKILLLLVVIVLIGFYIFTFSYFPMLKTANLGLPLPVDKLTEEKEFEIIFSSPIFSLVAFKENDFFDFRFVVGLPQMRAGEKFYIKDKQIFKIDPESEYKDISKITI